MTTDDKNKEYIQSDWETESVSFLERLVFKNRLLILLLFILVTIGVGVQASKLRPEASFLKMIPTQHPYIANFLKFKEELKGRGNAVRIAVETTQGDIFTTEYLDVLQKITDEVFFIPGVDRSGLSSLWTPDTRWFAVTEDGFDSGPVIPDTYDGSDQGLQQIRNNIRRSATLGKLVANDFKSTLLHVPLMEINPDTGQRLNYRQFCERLETLVRDKYQTDTIRIHITGFAKVVGDLITGSMQMALFFGIAVLITLGMLFAFFRCPRCAVLPVLCSIVAVIWQLGLLKVIGVGLNPYSMLVPFLIFAIGVSHSVQMINAIQNEAVSGVDYITAARCAFRKVHIAGLSALFTDGIGFATLAVIRIEVIQDIAIGASIGVLILIFTNLILLPVLMSYVGVCPSSLDRIRAFQKDRKHALLVFLSRITLRRRSVLVSMMLIAALVWATYASLGLKIGDLDPGAPELRPDSRYNRDNAFMIANYAASSDVFVVMTKTADNKVSEYETLVAIDRLQWELDHLQGVRSTFSINNYIKQILVAYNEGDFKNMTLSRNPGVNNSAVGRAPQALTGNQYNLASILIFLEDHKAETLQRVVDTVKTFSAENDTEERHFLMAAGNSGIEAATNIVISKAQYQMLALVYGVVVLVVFLTFRSWRAVICIVLPLALTSMLCQVLMKHLGIGVKVATLPVIALGVGIGVDYGIYMYSKFRRCHAQGMTLFDAYYQTLSSTGKAVCFTGATLAVGVCTWVFSAIKFQADMGLLLTFMFLFNMFGAISIMPALLGLVWPEKKHPSLDKP